MIYNSCLAPVCTGHIKCTLHTALSPLQKVSLKRVCPQ